MKDFLAALKLIGSIVLIVSVVGSCVWGIDTLERRAEKQRTEAGTQIAALCLDGDQANTVRCLKVCLEVSGVTNREACIQYLARNSTEEG